MRRAPRSRHARARPPCPLERFLRRMMTDFRNARRHRPRREARVAGHDVMGSCLLGLDASFPPPVELPNLVRRSSVGALVSQSSASESSQSSASVLLQTRWSASSQCARCSCASIASHWRTWRSVRIASLITVQQRAAAVRICATIAACAASRAASPHDDTRKPHGRIFCATVVESAPPPPRVLRLGIASAPDGTRTPRGRIVLAAAVEGTPPSSSSRARPRRRPRASRRCFRRCASLRFKRPHRGISVTATAFFSSRAVARRSSRSGRAPTRSSAACSRAASRAAKRSA